MGLIQSLCCRETFIEDADEQEEQSRIWSENNNNCQQYGSCLPPTPPVVYRIVLPKLKPVDIDCNLDTANNSSQLTTSSSTNTTKSNVTTESPNPLVDGETNSSDLINLHQHNDDTPTSDLAKQPLVTENQNQSHPAVIKEEYCAEQFERIRSFIFDNDLVQKKFKQLLWSCIPWSAPGGKSGSTFMKTINDQFILKEMSKLELQSFLSIADEYFAYVQKSYHDDRPSLLSTILGIFRIVYTSSTTQSSSEYYFMVMPNLFYNRNIAQRFDLKGSMRNRLVNTNDPDNTEHVLMDENFLRLSCESPLLIHSSSKQILNEAIANDSSFLTSISVMDYSLLVGVDRARQELVVGIIDYVRPFTWDKKIERVVKSVVSTELPTIVEPDLYRERFCEAMDKYFESVPEMFKINLYLFARLREIVGSAPMMEIELGKTSWTCGELRSHLIEHLCSNYNCRMDMLPADSLMLAINESYKMPDDQITLQQNDLIALIPPVSGG